MGDVGHEGVEPLLVDEETALVQTVWVHDEMHVVLDAHLSLVIHGRLVTAVAVTGDAHGQCTLAVQGD